jgi:diaminopimelate epimerase
MKMNGAGNDFVFLTREKTRTAMTPALVRLLMDRHFGIGGDQLLLLEKAGPSPALTIYNSDGSQAEMCGNGVRAVAYYLRSRGYPKDFVIRTKAGPIGIGQRDGAIEVDMGRPVLDGPKIPVRARGEVMGRSLRAGRERFLIHGVSMGNPHCVIFVHDVDRVALEKLGPLIENHPFFPKRVNVEFAQVLSRSRIRARVWERGAGITLACGTGACAIAVAAARAGLTGRRVAVDLPGGRLTVRWAGNDHVFLSGPACVSYEGRFFRPS